MQEQAFSDEQASYELDNGFSLDRADSSTDFGTHWVAYRPNESFHQNWSERYTDIQQVPFRFWIMKDEARIGGCLLRPNLIADLFLIPPFSDYQAFLEQVMPLVKQWSDDDRPIYGQYILSEQVSAFEARDFTIMEQRLWMIRPTLAYEVSFDEPFTVVVLTSDQKEHYADVFYSSFSGGIGGYGRRERDDHLQSITRLLSGDDYIADASCAVIDNRNGQVVTVCLVTETAGHGCINFLVTHPDYQGQGLGKQAMLYAINALYGHYSWVTLAVTVGNPALNLYRNLGFADGTAIHSVQLNA